MSLSRRQRLENLRDHKQEISQLSLEEIASLASSVVGDYALYTDRELRNTAASLLKSIASKDSASVVEAISKALISKASPPATDIANLLQIVNEVSPVVDSLEIVQAQSKLILQLLQIHTKKSLSTSALRSTKASAGETATNYGAENYIKQLDLGEQGLVITGVLASYAEDFAAKVPGLEDALKQQSEKWCKAYVSTVLNYKTGYPAPYYESFHGFVRIISQSHFDEILVPAIARALLRSPEVVLTYSLPPLIKQLSLDLSLACEKFQSSLLSNLGSSNPSVRLAATSCIELLLTKCQPKEFVDAIIAGFKKASSSEQRALYAKMVALIEPSQPAADAIALVASKETTETTTRELALAATKLLPYSSQVLCKGISEKRAPLRREWVCAVATIKERPEDVNAALETVLSEVVANPVQAVSSKSLAAGYAAAAALGTTDAVSLLTERSVYERLSTPQEFYWALKAATALACENLAFADGCVYIVANAPHELKESATSSLAEIYTRLPSMGSPLAISLSEQLDHLSDPKTVMHVFGLKTPKSDETLRDALIVGHDSRALVKNGWIGLCLRAGVDPGELVQHYHDEMFNAILRAPAGQLKAADAALATIAFISPQLVSPKVVEYLKKILVPHVLDKDELLIYRTDASELAPTREVLKKKDIASSARGKDASLAKWEEEVRREVAKRQGGKLSPEDRKMLAEQAEIREKVSRIVHSHDRAISFIDALSQGTENGIDIWFPTAVAQLLLVSKSELGQSARDCLLGLTRNISSRFTTLRKNVGVALLFKLNLSKVGSSKIVMDVLYRCKFLADQRPLDSVTLVYILPALSAILKEASRKFDEETTEQLLLALSILATEADELDTIPRGDLIWALITLLEKNKENAKDVKDCLQRVAQGVLLTDEEQHALLAATCNENPYVRAATLEIIDAECDLRKLGFAPEIFISRFGDQAPIAHTIWEQSSMKIPDDALVQLEPFLGYSIREASARAFAAVVIKSPSLLTDALAQLIRHYKECLEPPKPEYDEFGMEIRKPYKDPWEKRSGALLTLQNLVAILPAAQVEEVAEFIARDAVRDEAEQVRDHAHAVGLAIVEDHGASCLDTLLPLFEKYLDEPSSAEHVRQARVLLYGMEARHLDPSDERLSQIVDKLVETLLTPSESVQVSVSQCLAPLAKNIDPQEYFDKLSQRVFAGKSKHDRKGAAYGLAGIVNGRGIASLSDYGIYRAIFENAEDKKDPLKREGAQFAIDCLSQSLGKLFEPFALELLPIVLAGLGDPQIPVRAAATDAARSVMKHTTGYGIKQQIPLTLDRLNDTAWRGKKGAVELLGTMAYLDPQQLSTSLSTIIPEIVGVLNDTHKEVRAAAKGSLHSFGEVIKNPEIRQITPQLLDAISDPTQHTEAALDALLKTKFVHYIDSPSLAIVIHVLKRGLRDRSASTKKRSCQVVGNMSILTEPQDLIPYLPEIMPDLQEAMVDPVPATGATASKALGVLVEKLGEETFPTVIPDMFETLKDPSKVGDRWGVAQGLSEVIHGLGISKLEELLPYIVKSCSSPKPHIRQSFIPLLLFLPASFGQAITPYLQSLIPGILHGLADNLDDVRENALKAGRRVVRNFASKAVDLLLPELELGLNDPNYRIRLSSVELTGDLLFQLSGVNKNNSDDIATGKVQSTLMEVLGSARRDRILASLFICRADVTSDVRNSAVEVWMTLVSNTPRTVKDILPILTQMVVKRLSDNEEEIRSNAARALGELVRRVSGALVQLLPTFDQLLADPDAKEGICIGISELVEATPVDVLREHEPQLTKIIRSCLTDLNDSIREAASQAFDTLQAALGEVAQDILPELISQMEAGDDGALAALKEMMTTSPDVVFPALLPKLLESPINLFKANSLADICEAAGDNIYGRIDDIVDDLLDAIVSDSESDHEAASGALDRVLAVYAPQLHLLNIVKNEVNTKRCVVFEKAATVFSNYPDQIDMIYVPDWITAGILALDDVDEPNVKASLSMLTSLTSTLHKSKLAELVAPTHRALKMTSAPVAGFQLPKGVSSILPIFLHGLTLGTNKDKEIAALAIADIIERTEPANLKPYVTQITGPLIRVVGERYPSEVKAGIMYTLNVLLSTIPQFLRPFLPQLQRTFAKSLSDPTSALLRNRAAKALGTLIALQSRLDPLVKEIAAGIQSSEDPGVITAMLSALFEIVIKAGDSLSEASTSLILDLLNSIKYSTTDIQQVALIAKITGGLIKTGASTSELQKLVQSRSEDMLTLLTANALFVYAPEQLSKLGDGFLTELCQYFELCSRNAHEFKSNWGVCGLAKYILSDFERSDDGQAAIEALIESTKKDDNRSPETRRLALIALRALAREKREMLKPYNDQLVLPLFAAVRDTVIPVKLAAENTFLDVFEFVELGDSSAFSAWFDEAMKRDVVPQNLQRSLPEYVRRVALRHATSRREQIAAGTLDNDMSEDLQEVWAVGPTTTAH